MTDRRRQWCVAVAAAALLARAPPGHAQSVEDLRNLSIEQLANIQVSSVSKSPQPLSDAAAAIYVIGHDDIIRSGATSIPEMLRLAPNLEVAQLNATSYAISARGFNVGDNASLSNKLLVMIDGRSVYTPLFGGVYWDMQEVLPEDVDHIEVISGPGAALWGANAVNGVINIITRPSADTQGGFLTLGAGNLERMAALQYGGTLAPDLTYRLHGEGFSYSPDQDPNGGSAHDGWSKPQGGFRLDWTPPGDNLSVQGDIYEAWETPNQFIDGRDLMATWRHQFDNGSNLQLLTYYDEAGRIESNGGSGFTLDTYDIELQHGFSIGDRNAIVWGAGERAFGYRFENTALQLVPSSQVLNLADVFGQDTVTLTDRLKLTVGLKLEDEPYAGLQPMPSVRASWKAFDSTLLWAAVSRAVRSPTPVDENLREYGGPIDFLNGSSGFRPETLTAYELGTRVQATPRLSFSVSTYYDVYDDLRTIELSPSGGLPLQFGNMMAGTVYGMEIWGNWQVADWWRLTAGLDVLHEKLSFLPGASQFGGLAFAADDPDHQATLRSDVNFGHGVTWDADLREVAALPHPVVPGYTELNTRVGWAVNPKLDLSVSGFNLLHPRHLEFLEDGETDAIPRSFFLQARFRF
jgi:iron complex outermembrane recepter protein